MIINNGELLASASLNASTLSYLHSRIEHFQKWKDEKFNKPTTKAEVHDQVFLINFSYINIRNITK